MPDRFVRFLISVADQHKYSIRVTAILLSQQDGGRRILFVCSQNFRLASVASVRLHLHRLSEGSLDMPDRFVRFFISVADQHKYSIRVTAILLSQQDGGRCILFVCSQNVKSIHFTVENESLDRNWGRNLCLETYRRTKSIFIYNSFKDNKSPVFLLLWQRIVFVRESADWNMKGNERLFIRNKINNVNKNRKN
jgi:tRNA pseudouridine-54 N-methylase